MPTDKIHLAIDGNEANVLQRVGSNVYAFEILKAPRQIINDHPNVKATVLLRTKPVEDWPEASPSWRYQVLKPNFLWTQLAAPIHLYFNQIDYDVFYTPGHYAPRLCPIPYLSSVMDLAYLKFPEQYRASDLIQLKYWTKYSLKHAQKIVAISDFTKQDLIKNYQLPADKILVAPPAVSPQSDENKSNQISQAKAGKNNIIKNFFEEHQIEKPYFLFLGTFQPRKNLLRLIEAYEIFCQRLSSQDSKNKDQKKTLPQLVLAGKIGWLAEPILTKINQSAFKESIITPGFVPSEVKADLYQNAKATLLLGLYEGFGLPPLEALQVGSLPIVANNTSLPEAVGQAGLTVDPTDIKAIADKFELAYHMTDSEKETYDQQAQNQLAKFSWDQSAQIVFNELIKIAEG